MEVTLSRTCILCIAEVTYRWDTWSVTDSGSKHEIFEKSSQASLSNGFVMLNGLCTNGTRVRFGGVESTDISDVVHSCFA